MSEEDTITVVENYCVACEGECTNNDPEDYAHLAADWDAFTGAWIDKGASPSAVWAFLGSILLGIARENGLDWDDVREALELAWKKGTPDDE